MAAIPALSARASTRTAVVPRLLAAALLVFCALNAGMAYAYYPHAGDRAADIYGRDIVNGGVAHLEDYAGKWVWVEFWSPG